MKSPCTCALCATTFESRTSYGLCPACWSRDRLREWDRLQTAAKHARRAHLPVTLTLVEWLSTISAFSGLCAWCREMSYSYIEMVHPLYGLTYDNVAPICRACGKHKHHSFDEAQSRVVAYLAGERPLREDEQMFAIEETQEEVYAHQTV